MSCLFVCESTSGGGIWNWPRSGIHRYSTVVTSKYPSKKTTQAPSSSSSSPDQAPTHHFKMGNLVRAASLYPVLPKRIRRDRCWVVGCRVHVPTAGRWLLHFHGKEGRGKGGNRGKYMDPCLRNRRQATIGPTCRTNDLFVLFSGDANGWARRCRMTELYAKRLVACGPQPSPEQWHYVDSINQNLASLSFWGRWFEPTLGGNLLSCDF